MSRRGRGERGLGLLGLSLGLAGCVGCAAPRAEEQPPPHAVAPPLEPPPAREGALDRDQVAARGRQGSPDEAIAELDRHAFGFPLDAAALAWLEGQELPPAVLDYLRKRSKVDWGSLRGDVDPDRPPPGPGASPGGG
ncbi:MAG: hypothetical protein AB7N76_36100 [Planctomycetota bacterium]